MVEKTTSYIKTTDQDVTIASKGLFTTLFVPVDRPILESVLLLHGMQEHSGRYHEFAIYLAELGLAVLLYDHIGHGMTAINVEELGYFQQVKPDERLINDAIVLHRHVKASFPQARHFIIGHSMGSFITRCVLQQVGSEFDGSVWIGTGTKTPGAEIFKGLLSLLNKISPRKQSRFINGIFSKMNNSKFRKEPDFDNSNWLSLSKANRSRFMKDSLCGIPFTHNAFYTLLKLVLKATSTGWQNSIPKKLPILLISGANDPIGNFGKGIYQIEDTLKKSGFADVSVAVYPELRHEILQEDNRMEVFETIGQWLKIH